MINEHHRPDLNDSLDDLLGGPMGEVRAEPVRAPADYQPKSFVEDCGKCRGTGRYFGPSSHGSQCFACNGSGKKVFKTSPDARRKNRAGAAARKAQLAADEARERAAAAEAWKAANPEVAAELAAGASRGNSFCGDLLAKLDRWGSLTDGQAAAVLRGKAKREQREAERAAREAAAPLADAAGVDRLKAAFDHAIERARSRGRGLRSPRITIGGVVISPAKETSANAGALYVKAGGTYLGKIKGGRFFSARECTPDDEKRVLSFIADPKAAAEAYGKETGVCCVCNAELTNQESISRGIGPVCAGNMGW